MQFLKELKALLIKELILEWKQKFAINGLLLYALTMVFVIALAFRKDFNPNAWNIIFWIILLFVAINAVAKSFIGESRGQLLYLYTLAGPRAVILAKMIYNAGLMLVLSMLALLAYFFFSNHAMQDLIGDPGYYWLFVGLGGMGFAIHLTLVSAIASRGKNSGTLMAILGFPLMIPLMLTCIGACRNAMDGLPRTFSQDELLFSIGFIVIVALLSLILFPFLWKE